MPVVFPEAAERRRVADRAIDGGGVAERHHQKGHTARHGLDRQVRDQVGLVEADRGGDVGAIA